MKKIFLIIIILFVPKLVYATNIEAHDFKNLLLSRENSEHESFNIDKLPDGMLYKLNTECKYILNDKSTLKIRKLENSEKIFYIIINENITPLGNEDYNPRTDASAYIIKSNSKLYLLIDKMHEYDFRYYNLYNINNTEVKLVEEESGRIDFVGYDYIIGYTDWGMTGYQQCEFKKVFRNGKLELDGEYKVVEDEDGCQFWVYYTLVKDLKYEEYDRNLKTYKEKVLKAGTKIRTLSTDAKTYIRIEIEDGRKGKVKVDRVDGRDFIVDGHLFMDYYFLDGSKYRFEVFRSVPAY